MPLGAHGGGKAHPRWGVRALVWAANVWRGDRAGCPRKTCHGAPERGLEGGASADVGNGQSYGRLLEFLTNLRVSLSAMHNKVSQRYSQMVAQPCIAISHQLSAVD